jgi:CBS domain-containing protein
MTSAQHMKKTRISSVLVRRNGRLAGIVSIEDVMLKVIEKANLDITVDEVMHFPEFTIDSEVKNEEKG